jgi:hypothetical protein
VNSSSAVIVFAYYYPPENTSGAARPERFVKYLKRLGARAFVVSAGDCGRGGLASPDGCVRVPDGKAPAGVERRSHAAFWFQRIFLPYQEHLPWLPFAAEAAERILAEHPGAALYSTSPPVVTHLAARRLARRHGLRWVADFRDPLVGNPFRASRRARLYDPLLQRAIFEDASAVVGNTEAACELWRKTFPRWREKFHTIWNGFDPEQEIPAPAGRRGTRRVLAHIGSLYGDRHPKQVLDSVARLIASGRLDPAAFQVRLVGPMEGLTVSLEEPPFRTLREMGCLEADGRTVPREEAAQAMADADYLLLLDLNADNSGLQVPAKIFDYLRTGRPVLACTARGSSVSHILDHAGVPNCRLYPGEPAAVVDEKLAGFLCAGSGPYEASEWFQRSFNALDQTRALGALLGLGV